jgi:hypothetical protein
MKFMGRFSTPLFSLLAISISVAQPTYSTQPIPIRSGFHYANGVVAVSPHGNFFITQEADNANRPHYFLHGPTLSTTPQDLNGSAGLYGPNTNGQYWPGKFILVNDKGLTIAQLQTSPNGPITNYLYSHSQHELTDLNLPGPGFTPTYLDDYNKVGGIGLTSTGSLPERLDPDGALKVVEFNGYSNVQCVSGPIVTDDGYIVGTITYSAGAGTTITTGYSYKPGSLPAVFGKNTSVAGINDSDIIVGYCYSYDYRTWDGYLSDAQGHIYLFLPSQHFQGLTMLGEDNFGHQIAYQDSANNPLVFWNGNSVALSFSSLVTSGTYSDPVFNASMDLSGNVYYNVPVNGAMQGWIATPN